MPIAEWAQRRAGTDPERDRAVGLTPHFRAWLIANGYVLSGFQRPELIGGGFGGRADEGDRPRRRPVVFIHGNADAALGTPHHRHSGWQRSIEHFMANGYRPSELYAFTWGEADSKQSLKQYHSKRHLVQVRGFLSAVLAYTGAEAIDVIGHSMGVTLVRKAIKGGRANDLAAGGAYDLGPSIAHRVDTLIGIAGANYGLMSSYFMGNSVPISASTNGFYPGALPGAGPSRFLRELNADPTREARRIYTIWSTVDEVIGPGNLVWGRRTSRIPGQNGERVFDHRPYGHIGLKDETVAEQLAFLTGAEVEEPVRVS